MKENKEFNPKMLRKEVFAVKSPKRIVVGDPYYMETVPQERLKKLVAAYKPPEYFETRLAIEESETTIPSDCEKHKFRAIEIYMAPRTAIDIYMKSCMYEGQKVEQKPIGVDTARYIIDVGDRRETYHTGGDGYWGDAYEYRHKEGEKSYVDGVVIVLTMPEYMSFEKVKDSMNYLFEDMCPLPEETAEKKSVKKQQPER